MFSFLSNRWGLLLSPFIVFFCSLWALTNITAVPVLWLDTLSGILPVSLLCVGLFLSIQFNRSRYSFLLLFLSIGAGLALYLPHWQGTAAYSSILMLLLLNSSVFVFLKDRSLFSIHGLLRLAFIGAQCLLLYFLVDKQELILEELLQRDLLQIRLYLPWLYLPDVVLVTGLLSCLLCLTLLLKESQSIYAVFVLAQWALLVFACDLPLSWQGMAPALLFNVACLLVCLSILLDSHDMAYRDELTALPSRRALNQKLLSLGRNYSIAMLDIDHFKKFNDTHGHDVGDQVLQMVASKIAKVTGGGTAYRYGGEEFTVVYAGKTPEQVEAHLDKLRETIQDYAMQVREASRPVSKPKAQSKAKSKSKRKTKNKPLSVTISIGLAARTTEHKTPEQVVKAADKALYRAKGNGRNCVSL